MLYPYSTPCRHSTAPGRVSLSAARRLESKHKTTKTEVIWAAGFGLSKTQTVLCILPSSDATRGLQGATSTTLCGLSDLCRGLPPLQRPPTSTPYAVCILHSALCGLFCIVAGAAGRTLSLACCAQKRRQLAVRILCRTNSADRAGPSYQSLPDARRGMRVDVVPRSASWEHSHGRALVSSIMALTPTGMQLQSSRPLLLLAAWSSPARR